QFNEGKLKSPKMHTFVCCSVSSVFLLHIINETSNDASGGRYKHATIKERADDSMCRATESTLLQLNGSIVILRREEILLWM
ncbi:hypothetical protein HHI36_002421, partial [Cryptolaemus montrouzieri]